MSWKVETQPDGSATWSGSDAVADPFAARSKALFNVGGCAVVVLGLVLAGGVGAKVGEWVWTTLRKTRWDWLFFHPPAALKPVFGVLIDLKDVFAFATFFLVAGLVLWLIWRMTKHEAVAPLLAAPTGFFERDWTLWASATGLSYNAGPFSGDLDSTGVGTSHWSVRLDDIARVEVGRTADWQTRRFYPGGPLYVQGAGDSGVIFSDGSFPLSRTAEFQTFLYLNDGSRRVIYTVNAMREEAGMLAHSIRAWVEAARAMAKQPDARTAEIAPSMDRQMEGFDI